MRQVNLAQVADELYALAPAEFRAARDERAGQERAAGHRELADAIGKLRRPTVSAWLVNRLAREAADQVDRLLELGESLREAQQELAGDRLRELSAQRRQAITPLIQAAKRIASGAGQSVSAQVEREVLATFEAALADPDAAEAVRSGWLTSALSYVGLGGGDLAEVVAITAAPGRARSRAEPEQTKTPAGLSEAAGPAPTARETSEARREQRGGPAEAKRRQRGAAETRQQREEAAQAWRQERQAAAAQRAAREAEAAESDLREAAAMAQEAKAALEDAERGVAGARERQDRVRRRIEELEQQLAASEAERAEAARSSREAQRLREGATRSLDAAQRRLARAQARADRHRTG
ncbi:MAG TPA: hypothetical protein VIV12_24120 [Streptosporangiaceae bacterium]